MNSKEKPKETNDIGGMLVTGDRVREIAIEEINKAFKVRADYYLSLLHKPNKVNVEDDSKFLSEKLKERHNKYLKEKRIDNIYHATTQIVEILRSRDEAFIDEVFSRTKEMLSFFNFR